MLTKKLKTIRSRAALARFLAECDERAAGFIVKPAEPKTPYEHGQTKIAERHPQLGPVAAFEVAHRRWEVWGVRSEAVKATEAEVLPPDVATVVEHESGETTVLVGRGAGARVLALEDYSTKGIAAELQRLGIATVEWRGGGGCVEAGDLPDGTYGLLEWRAHWGENEE